MTIGMTTTEVAEALQTGLHEAEKIVKTLPHYKAKGYRVSRLAVELYALGMSPEEITEFVRAMSPHQVAALVVERSNGIADAVKELAMRTAQEALARAFAGKETRG